METKNHKVTITGNYDMQNIQDELYARSKKGKVFTQIMGIIRNSHNIKLAYRAIKKNKGSYIPGTDKKNIEKFTQMNEEEYIKYIQTS